jgi:RNA polymerase sigma factor (sigma-70 family)
MSDDREDIHDRLVGIGRMLTPLARHYARDLKDPSSWEDLVSETVTRVWMARESIRNHNCVEGFARTTLHNVFLERIRKRRPNALEEAGNIADHRETPVGQASRAELGSAISAALNKLTARSRELFERVFLRGETQKGAAKKLGLSQDAAKNKAVRVRAKLRELLRSFVERLP